MLTTVFFLSIIVDYAFCESVDLYNTKSATSDLQWTVYPTYGGWEEVSGLDVDGTSIRSYQVCSYKVRGTNNWVRTPYIPSRGARRAYIDVEFSMMKCDGLDSSCRETFNLYYFEADNDEASSTYPPWRENPYVKIDTIAAGERFSNSDTNRAGAVNHKTWTLGPLSRNGFYIAAHDQGACMSILSLRVYYFYCSQTVKSLATFPSTIAGNEVASLDKVDGQCVVNANSTTTQAPRYYCNSNGEWKVRTGTCHCKPGYQANRRMTSCEVCGSGRYKSSHGNHECSQCPDHSMSARGMMSTQEYPNRDTSSDFCVCELGYYRTELEDIHSPCSNPPSAPTHVRFDVNATSVLLQWLPPISDGERDDLYYNVSCDKCSSRQVADDDKTRAGCKPCSDYVTFQPSNQQQFHGNSIVARNLEPFTVYRFKIFAMNGVTSLSGSTPQHALVLAGTSEAAPSSVVDLRLASNGSRRLTLTWTPPLFHNGVITKYQVEWTDVTSVAKPGLNHGKPAEATGMIETNNTTVMFTDLLPKRLYALRVRAATSAGSGPYSSPLTIPTPHNVDSAEQNQEPSTIPVALVVAMSVVAVVVCLVIASLCYLYRRKRANKKNVTEEATDDEKKSLNQEEGWIVRLPSCSRNQRTYVKHPNPLKADFSCEIDPACLSLEPNIGTGEFGEVCRGRLRQKDRTVYVAVKMMKGGVKDQFNFLREASTMAQFSHPNILTLTGVVTKSQPQMIVTEYMENGSLDSLLKTKREELSVIQLLEMLKGIASGMRYLSSMKYVHRDLAARNILLNSDLVCKVSDFGLSRTLENDPHATYTTQGGKIALRWTAPECIRCRKFTLSSDVWSYGIVMWEVMSFGEIPYWDMDNQEILESIDEGYRLPAPYGCPVSLHRLMVECWAFDPTKRPKIERVYNQIDQLMQHPSQLTKVNLHICTTPTTPTTDEPRPIAPA